MPRERARTSSASREPKRPGAFRLWLRRRRPLLRPALKGVVVLGLAGVIVAAVAAFDPASRLSAMSDGVTSALTGLEVKKVEMAGVRNTPEPLIRAALSVRPGDPILAFSPDAARERLESLAWIESAEVERRLSGTIHVRVTERAPFAIWQNRGRFVIVDREGRTIATDRLDAFGPLPLIVGAGAERHAAALYDLLREAPEVLARTQAMVRVSERRWNLHLHNGADVLLPEGHEAVAIDRLKELHRSGALLDRPLVAVDMRLPDKLVLRQVATEAPAQPAPARGRRG